MDWWKRTCKLTSPLPVLNPLDFCIWEYLKSLVYSSSVGNIDDLRNSIIAGCETIRNSPGIFQNIRNNFWRGYKFSEQLVRTDQRKPSALCTDALSISWR
ncbi:hypothetical protein NQ318_012197 [Aromia moschata]|uniref:Uncharacterized protein n=1 Tax=Aromia moschata TaxID=1265417 RepID=A0AAV8Z0A5_9CUCU|nr:hypothetical protein NQ318_012197 [Aromia moschata]